MAEHSEKYEVLFILDAFANRRAWLDQTKIAYHAYKLQCPLAPDWDDLVEPLQIAWGEAIKAVILDDRKGKGKPAFAYTSGGA